MLNYFARIAVFLAMILVADIKFNLQEFQFYNVLVGVSTIVVLVLSEMYLEYIKRNGKLPIRLPWMRQEQDSQSWRIKAMLGQVVLIVYFLVELFVWLSIRFEFESIKVKGM